MISLKVDSDIELKMLELADAHEIFKLINGNRHYLRKWLPWLDFTKEENDTLGFIKRMRQDYANGVGIVFAIVYQDAIVGAVGAHNIDTFHKKASIGYWLAENFQGKGITSRSCIKLIDYLFSELKLVRVESAAAVGNRPSRNVLSRIGMKEEGISRQCEFLYDHHVDHVKFSILRSEWSE